jgi:penicillin-binding protein 1A
VGNLAGLDAVRKVADDAGLGPVPRFPAIYLGAFECSLRDLVSAYTVFPNNGVRRQPYLISRVEDAHGKPIYQAASQDSRALMPGVCSLVTTGLQKVMERGTGASANFRGTAAGKTGTTNDYKDAWFVGYTRTLTCGVWVGLDEPAPIMAHGYGAALALPIWSDVMNSAADRYASRGFQEPEGVVPQVVRPGEEQQSSPAPRKAFPSRFMNSVRHLFGGGD